VLEHTLRVRATDLEEVFDSLLPALPGGVHISRRGVEAALTVTVVTGTPAVEELRSLTGTYLLGLSSTEVSDDWRERRLARYEPLVVAERFLLRPEWAPPGKDPALIEIILAQSPAFGTGLHPTTQACLAILAEIDPGGSVADVGCGSGVLAIAAAKLGYSPVLAVDVDPTSVAVASRNAERNGVEVDARRIDVTVEPPATTGTLLANVPPDVHAGLAGRLERSPSLLVASGFKPNEIAAVTSAWERHGLSVADEVRANEWSVLVMR
jgi:ribosomal protein L11 methyltransferase